MKSLLLQTDFGLCDSAVSAMKGVAKQVNENLNIYDLTHEITPYDIWSASYRIIQTIDYWPNGTVFVSVVDPGVGSKRKSVAVKTKGDKIVITPDNGTLTHLLHRKEIIEARLIDENVNRLNFSQESHTFHGRDIYAYNGARIASGEISYEEIGEKIDISELISLEVENAKIENNMLLGNIDVLDVRFGSLWTNISLEMIKEFGIKSGDNVYVSILKNNKKVYKNEMQFVRSFAEVEIGEPLIYVNSLLNLGVAINQDSFSKLYNIGYGKEWKIRIEKS